MRRIKWIVLALWLLGGVSPLSADEPAGPLIAKPVAAGKKTESSAGVLPPLYERFGSHSVDSFDVKELGETPDFQKHVSPLLGRLGCNGRACHGSFQGQGGFQLSLFGYDFAADYEALLEDGAARVDRDDFVESLILTKPVDADYHDGGKRYEPGEWEYWVLRSWIEAGAPFEKSSVQELERLEVIPNAIEFASAGDTQPLQVIAHWSDGTAEDVTCLSRFQSNDKAIAAIDEQGKVTSGEAGDTHVVVSYDNAVVPVQTMRPMSELVGDKYPKIATKTTVDQLVVNKLRKLGIVPSDICTDAEFLRRATLDVTGTLPSPEEVREFVTDTSNDKRERLVEDLLSRDAYAAQWTTFLCDITGNNEDQLRNFMPSQVQPANQWYQWIFKRLQDNVPYDQIVEGMVTATSRMPDESYAEYCETMSEICRDTSGASFAERPGMVHYWARNNFRTAEDRAIGFAYSFLGIRIQCAQCHKHPFDQWSKADFDNFEGLFGTVQARQNTLSPEGKKEFPKMVSSLGLDKDMRGNKLRQELGKRLKAGDVVPLPELIVAKPRSARAKGKAKPASVPKAKLLGGEWIEMDQPDVRGKLMGWLRDPNNPYFAKAIANRVWAQYFSVGIVNPPDDLNLANAPSNGPLLDYLAEGFVENGYDLKWLHREILNSDTYQRSWVPNDTNAQDKHNFSHSQLRRLPAEATYDAVRVALANDDYAAKIRDLAMPRALTKTGASARNQNRSDESYALTVFGRSIRESNCDCDRSSEPSLLQTVFLLNDSAVQGWLTDSKTSWVSEVAKKYDWPLGDQSAADRARLQSAKAAMERFKKQITEGEKRLEEVRAAGQDRTVKAIEKRLKDAKTRARQAVKRFGMEDEWKAFLAGDSLEDARKAVAMTSEQAEWIASNAYLRTLGRQPTQIELDTSISFLLEEEKPAEAVEGLLWSLINTKEFILNH